MISYKQYTDLPEEYVKSKIREFLEEDMPAGDVTTLSTIPAGSAASAEISAQAEIVFAGEKIIPLFFGEGFAVKVLKHDGERVLPGGRIALIDGPAREILSKERPLLNLLQRLCGIATQAARYAAIAAPLGVKVLDTRKTTPGLRLFEKYAVAVGGGTNHRLDLSSGILIKDNHIQAAGSITRAVEYAREYNAGLPLELEVENFDQLREGLAAGADGFLLDNMPVDVTIEAVKIIRSAPGGNDIFIESSGGITLETLEGYCRTGVNAVSVGALTHSVKSAEMHMEFL